MIATYEHTDYITDLCNVLKVSRSGYYAWKNRRPSLRAQKDTLLAAIIRDLQKNHPFLRTYGSPRMTAELHAMGIACSQKRIARIMRENGMFAIPRKKFRTGTDARHDYPIAPNLLEQDFATAYPDQVWLCDGTYIWTVEGWLVLAAVLDLHTRRCIGTAMGPGVSSTLTIDALRQAITTRRPNPGVIVHSDRGGEYAATLYQQLLAAHQMQQSMSRTANCWDNAPMESFFATLKKELVYRQVYRTRREAELSIFHYIEGFYNTTRRHSKLGYISPREYEQKINQLSTNPPYQPVHFIG